MKSWLNRTGWITGAHHPCGLGAYRDRAGTDHGTLTDLNAWPHEGLGADPGIRADGDRPSEKRKGGRGVVVGAGAEVGTLRHHRPFTKVNWRH